MFTENCLVGFFNVTLIKAEHWQHEALQSWMHLQKHIHEFFLHSVITLPNFLAQKPPSRGLSAGVASKNMLNSSSETVLASRALKWQAWPPASSRQQAAPELCIWEESYSFNAHYELLSAGLSSLRKKQGTWQSYLATGGIHKI